METAAIVRAVFHAPMHQGQFLDVAGPEAANRKASVMVEGTLFAEDLRTGERRLYTHGTFVMPAVEERGKPVPLAPPMGQGPRP